VAYRLGGERSILLSYGRIFSLAILPQKCPLVNTLEIYGQIVSKELIMSSIA